MSSVDIMKIAHLRGVVWYEVQPGAIQLPQLCYIHNIGLKRPISILKWLPHIPRSISLDKAKESSNVAICFKTQNSSARKYISVS